MNLTERTRQTSRVLPPFVEGYAAATSENDSLAPQLPGCRISDRRLFIGTVLTSERMTLTTILRLPRMARFPY